MAADLENFLADRPIVARRSGPARAGVAVVPAEPGGGGVAGGERSRGAGAGWSRGRSWYSTRGSNGPTTSIRWSWQSASGRATTLIGAEQILDAIPAEYRGWEWNYLKRACHSEFKVISGFTNPVFGVAFSPDGQRIATASQNEGVMVWDAPTRQLLSATSLDLTAGSSRWPSVPTVSGSQRVSTSRATGRRSGLGPPRRGLKELMFPAHVGIIWCIAFSPDGKRLASAGEDGTVMIWNTETGELIKTLTDETQGFTSVAFSP